MAKGGNSSFIALIPKVENHVALNDFCPISLICCMYKIVAKLLANRLRGVMNHIIDINQSAFIGGRQMLDSVLVANETIDEAKSKKKACLVFKVDFEKAYDSVNWSFLYYMMQRLGFCDKWIRWIKGCVESASVSILVNGSPTEEFKMGRGLRQGDPLAPFLFLMVAEGLSGLMRQAIRLHLFQGFKVGGEEVEVSLLQFADDTLFIGLPSIQNVLVTKSVLRCFELMSGLKVNFSKSKLAGIYLDGKGRFAEIGVAT